MVPAFGGDDDQHPYSDKNGKCGNRDVDQFHAGLSALAFAITVAPVGDAFLDTSHEVIH